jgi:hypothetical protein
MKGNEPGAEYPEAARRLHSLLSFDGFGSGRSTAPGTATPFPDHARGRALPLEG